MAYMMIRVKAEEEFQRCTLQLCSSYLTYERLILSAIFAVMEKCAACISAHQQSKVQVNYIVNYYYNDNNVLLFNICL